MDKLSENISFEDLWCALNERDLFINPDCMEVAADEIDCCPGCESSWSEWDTGASGCKKSELGQYCPNDLAETLRSLAKVSRRSPKISNLQVTFDGGKVEYVTLADVLKWRQWSERERQAIWDVNAGRAPCFSTSRNGIYCDVSLRIDAALTKARGEGETA